MIKMFWAGKGMFLLLSAFLLYYYGAIFSVADAMAAPVFFAVLLFLIYGLAIQGTGAAKATQIFAPAASIIGAAVSGAAATFFLSTALFRPVIAASLVGLAYAVFTKHNERMKALSGPVYCGAFVGMTSNAFSVPEIVFAGLVAGIAQTIPRKEYDGTGGVLGTIAFIATYLTSKLSG